MKRSKENRKKHNRGSRKNRTKTLKQKKTTLNKTVTRKDSNETQSEKNKLSVDCQWTILSTKLTKPSTIPDSDVLKKLLTLRKASLISIHSTNIWTKRNFAWTSSSINLTNTQSENNKLSVDYQRTSLSTPLTKLSAIPDSDVLKNFWH